MKNTANRDICIVISALPHAGGFGRRMLDLCRRLLDEALWETRVQDLYEDRFDPVLRSEELHRHAAFDKLTLRYARELTEARLLLFVFPLWWNMPPAVLKGWLDRVLTPEFAYRRDDATSSHRGLLEGKKACVFATASQAVDDAILRPVWEELLSFCAMELSACYIADALEDRNTNSAHLRRVEALFGAVLKQCETR